MASDARVQWKIDKAKNLAITMTQCQKHGNIRVVFVYSDVGLILIPQDHSLKGQQVCFEGQRGRFLLLVS